MIDISYCWRCLNQNLFNVIASVSMAHSRVVTSDYRHCKSIIQLTQLVSARVMVPQRYEYMSCHIMIWYNQTSCDSFHINWAKDFAYKIYFTFIICAYYFKYYLYVTPLSFKTWMLILGFISTHGVAFCSLNTNFNFSWL